MSSNDQLPLRWKPLHHRIWRRWDVAYVVIFLLCATTLIISIFKVGLHGSAYVFAGVMSVGAITSALYPSQRKYAERLLNELREKKHLICPECMYDLRGRTGPVCPECSLPMTDEQLAATWEAIYERSRKTDES